MQKAYARHTHRSVFLRQLQWALQHATQSRLSETRHSFASCQKCWLLSYFLGISFGQRELSPSKLHTFFSGQPAPNDLLMKRYRGLNHLPQFKTPQFKGYSISEPGIFRAWDIQSSRDILFQAWRRPLFQMYRSSTSPASLTSSQMLFLKAPLPVQYTSPSLVSVSSLT